jgi:hypothetical protein
MENEKKSGKYVIRFIDKSPEEDIEDLIQLYAEFDPRLKLKQTLTRLYGKKVKKN